ncbi:MAG: glycosyltransferase family 2 protein [Nitrospirota bacterium]
MLNFIKSKFRFEQIPANDLESVDPALGKWKSLGNDPSFLLIPHDEKFPSGWVFIEAQIAVKETTGPVDWTAKLYYDLGSGFSESHAVAIPISAHGAINQIVLLPHGIRQLRWDPIQSCGIIEQTPICFSQVGFIERTRRMAWRVIHEIIDHKKNNMPFAYDVHLGDVLFNLPGAYAKSSHYRSRIFKDEIARLQSSRTSADPAFSRKERGAILYHLMPQHDLRCVNEANFSWRSLGSDPSFLLVSDANRHPSGWVLVQSTVIRKTESPWARRAKVFYDFGQGFSEMFATEIPVQAEGAIHEVLYFPDGIKMIRWDPMEGPGELMQASMQVTPISSLRAYLLMLQSLCGAYRKTDSARSIYRLIRSLIRLPEAYRDSQYLRNDSSANLPQVTKSVSVAMSSMIDVMERRPLISIVMPTYNTARSVLREAIESVRNQIYPHWELCVVDDASSRNETVRTLRRYAEVDTRIKILFNSENMGVSSASNRALELAEGEFIVLLDHDDVLEPQALFRIAHSIMTDSPDMIYSDEILFSEDGKEILHPVLRPSFSLELLRSHPYIVHLVAFKTSILRNIGGWDVTLDISQDYDLILRFAEEAKKIAHIPEVLYRWRQTRRSAGHLKEEQVMATSRAIIARHLERSGDPGTVNDSEYFNYFKVRYPLEPGLKIAIIIPTRNCGDLVKQCIESLERTIKDVHCEIVLIDHDSTEPFSLMYFDELKDRYQVLRYTGQFNFSQINNWAVERLHGDFSHYLFCNNDIEALEDGWLERMLELCQKKDVGIVGATLLYPDRKTIQHAGVCVGMFGAAEHYGKFMQWTDDENKRQAGYNGAFIATREVSSVTAACMLMRRDAFDKVGGFDEHFAVGFGDVDLCLRAISVGYRIIYASDAVLLHHESATRGKSTEDPHPEDSLFFTTRWKDIIAAGDPFYNPNLSSLSTKWEITLPCEVDVEVISRIYNR